jgi:hypothetical protein
MKSSSILGGYHVPVPIQNTAFFANEKLVISQIKKEDKGKVFNSIGRAIHHSQAQSHYYCWALRKSLVFLIPPLYTYFG